MGNIVKNAYLKLCNIDKRCEKSIESREKSTNTERICPWIKKHLIDKICISNAEHEN